MIDQNARNKYREDLKTKTLVEGLKGSISEALKNGNPNEEVLKLVVKREEEQELLTQVGKLERLASMIHDVVKKPIVLPRIFQVEGKVEVTRPVTIRNLSELERYFKSLEQKINLLAQAASTAPPPRIEIPKIEIPKVAKQDNKRVELLLERLIEKIEDLNVGGSAEVKFPKTISIDNFPVQMTPQPVTNISINPNQGLIKTTSDTVGTSLTALPSYGRLFNRRALMIFNNSGNTIYIGGSDVTTSNGFPVTANNFSPTIDAGYNQIVYGIAGEAGNNVRIIEVAAKSEGGVAIQS